jgi:hypothetical protein
MKQTIETIESIFHLLEDGKITGVTFTEDERTALLRNSDKPRWSELQAVLESNGGVRMETLRAFRAKLKEDRARCVYCPNPAGRTRDHIPPQSFFAPPLPPDLITVPCCKACQEKDQTDDQFIKHLITSLITTEIHPTVAKDIAQRNYAGFKETPSKAQKLMDITVMTPRGPAFNFDDTRVDRFFERVTRAILYHAEGQTYFPAQSNWFLQKIGLGIYNNPPSDWTSKRVADIFHFLIAPTEKKRIFGVAFNFYDGLFIGCDLLRDTPLAD